MLWPMFGRFFSRDDLLAKGEAMRRAHSSWLTRALRRGSRVPRIPTRLVRDGGFGPVMSTPEGRLWAAEFWSAALEDAEQK